MHLKSKQTLAIKAAVIKDSQLFVYRIASKVMTRMRGLEKSIFLSFKKVTFALFLFVLQAIVKQVEETDAFSN